MNVIGIKVKHILLGIGTVVEQDDTHISVEFKNKKSSFLFPDAFEKHIKAEDPDVQNEIIQSIHEKKAEAERIAEEDRCRAAEEVKAKAIDQMFGVDFHVEHMARQPILTYQQVEAQFGIRISGFGRGINLTDDSVVLISSIEKAGGEFVYHDRWTVEGDYIYSGEGKVGDQTLTKGNLAIVHAAKDGKKIQLFIKLSPQEYYYQGVFELVDYTYEDEKDENGNIRKEYKFRLRKKP